MRNSLILAFLTFGLVFAANAQTVKMTSVYTNLKNDCRAEQKIIADEVPFICKAVGGYRARIIPAGVWAESLEIVDAAKKTVASLGTHGYGYSNDGRRMLEWRLANGVPFAVIFRVNKYDSKTASESGDNPYLNKYKIGEVLIIRGLKNYSQIDFEVDGKSKNANFAAQKMADENFH